MQFLPQASETERQLGLSWAACHGPAARVRLLLDAGADPDRYNPPGARAHCTPLHSAAIGGHVETVKALLAAGARADTSNIHHGQTPEGWAAHAGTTDIVDLLMGR